MPAGKTLDGRSPKEGLKDHAFIRIKGLANNCSLDTNMKKCYSLQSTDGHLLLEHYCQRKLAPSRQEGGS